MAGKPNRYKELERYMTYALCIDAALFFFYLLAAGSGVIWLKVIFTLMCLGISGLLLWVLYTSRELFRQRSLWITVGAGAIIICLLFSLLLKFPSPNKYKTTTEKSAYAVTQQI